MTAAWSPEHVKCPMLKAATCCCFFSQQTVAEDGAMVPRFMGQAPHWGRHFQGSSVHARPSPAESIPVVASKTRRETPRNHTFLPPTPFPAPVPLTRKLLQPRPLWAPILSILPPKQLDLRRLRGAASSALSLFFRRADLSEESQGPRPRTPASRGAGLTSPVQGDISGRGLSAAPASSFCSLSTCGGMTSSSNGILSSKWSSKFFTKGKHRGRMRSR